MKKRGNLSEFHSERNYYLQNWYFRDSTKVLKASVSLNLIEINPPLSKKIFIKSLDPMATIWWQWAEGQQSSQAGAVVAHEIIIAVST